MEIPHETSVRRPKDYKCRCVKSKRVKFNSGLSMAIMIKWNIKYRSISYDCKFIQAKAGCAARVLPRYS